MENLRDIKWRVYTVYFILFGIGIAVLFQLFRIQLVEGEYWRGKAYSLATEMRPVQATRGNILADDGSMLATSVPVYDIRMDMKAEGVSESFFRSRVDSLATCLARLFGDKSALAYKHQLITARKNGERYHLVKSRIDYNQLQVVKTFPIFSKGRFKGGVVFEKKDIRKMPFGFLAQRSIGYTREGVKPVGLEGAYDSVLAGSRGVRLEKRLAGGVWMPISDENEIEPEDGLDVHTTLDVNIQDVASNALLRQLNLSGADHGCVVLMEVKTGHVKAIANLTRNPDGTYAEKYNYALGEITEPGSTFKLASLIAAIEDGYITIEDTVDTKNGVVSYYGIPMHDTREGGYGKITMKRAFEVSSNVGISKVISRHYSKNPRQFVDRLYAMGLHKPLGLEIAGEGRPEIKSPDDTVNRWTGITLTQMSIGYEVLLTPMQILTFYNAVANNGTMVRPQFVTHLGKNGKTVREIPTTVLNEKICSDRTLKQVHEALEGVVDNGTATNLKSAHYKIAGKTGTARIALSNLGYHTTENKLYQASFVGYFPADNPLYSCIVVVNSPSNSVYYGNVVAGPIFREIADKVYSNRIDTHKEINTRQFVGSRQAPVSLNGHKGDLLTVVKTLGLPVKNIPADGEWITTSARGNAIITRTASQQGINATLIPDVTGMGLQDALFLLENAGLKVEVLGKGAVRWQSLRPGTPIQPNMLITLGLL